MPPCHLNRIKVFLLLQSKSTVEVSSIGIVSSGRAVAKEMGMSYFETSVLTFFGVNEVFENAIRAALCSRRTQRFWMTNLRRVLKPALQVLAGY